MCSNVMMASIQTAGNMAQAAIGYGQAQSYDKAMKQAARQELTAAAVEETNMRKASREFLARQRVHGLASGVDIASGSFARLAEEDVQTLELNALMRRYEGEQAADALKLQGRQAQQAATFKLATSGSIFSAGADALGGSMDFDGFSAKSGKGSIKRKSGISRTTTQGPI